MVGIVDKSDLGLRLDVLPNWEDYSLARKPAVEVTEVVAVTDNAELTTNSFRRLEACSAIVLPSRSMICART
jgi:hypothetical protein